jgi:hypothetical protein
MTKGVPKMTKLNPDSAPTSGRGSDQDRLSDSPQSLRRGGADPVDVHDSPVTSETGDLGYDKYTRKSFGTDPWAESH